MEPGYCPTWLLIARLAEDHGVMDFAALPGCWVCALDHEWELVVNGKDATQLHRGLLVPPGLCAVTRLGATVAWVGPSGMQFSAPEGWGLLYDAITRHREWLQRPA